jgi:hypothetical protein
VVNRPCLSIPGGVTSIEGTQQKCASGAIRWLLKGGKNEDGGSSSLEDRTKRSRFLPISFAMTILLRWHCPSRLEEEPSSALDKE